MMKTTTPGLVVLALVCFTTVDNGRCQRSLQSVPLTGLGSVRPLRGSSSFSSSSASVNLTAVEEELIETLEVDQQVTGEC